MLSLSSCVVKAFGAIRFRIVWNEHRSSSDPGSFLLILASWEPDCITFCTIRVQNSAGLLLVLSDRNLELIRTRYPFGKGGDSFGPLQNRRGKWAMVTCVRKFSINGRFRKMRMSNIFLMHETELPCMHARGRDNSKTSNWYFWSDSAPLAH